MKPDDQLRAAAQAILDNADRPGARLFLNGGSDGSDVWEDYREVPQWALDALKSAIQG